MSEPAGGAFNTQAAVTRSMLGWGVLAGPVYLVVGLAQALTRDGFDLASHQLSLLMLGEWGWVQAANLIITGVLVAIAAVGFRRVTGRERAGRAASVLLMVFALGLVASGIFPPDPMGGFPPREETDEASLSGVLHLGFGTVQFLALAAACFVTARWWDARHDASMRRFSLACGVTVVTGFAGGAALATSLVGLVLLWIAVLASFVWLGVTTAGLWRATPHPDADRRRSDRAAIPTEGGE